MKILTFGNNHDCIVWGTVCSCATLDDVSSKFLSDSNFRLPGEAQKIARLVEAFGHYYVEANRDTSALANEGLAEAGSFKFHLRRQGTLTNDLRCTHGSAAWQMSRTFWRTR